MHWTWTADDGTPWTARLDGPHVRWGPGSDAYTAEPVAFLVRPPAEVPAHVLSEVVAHVHDGLRRASWTWTDPALAGLGPPPDRPLLLAFAAAYAAPPDAWRWRTDVPRVLVGEDDPWLVDAAWRLFGRSGLDIDVSLARILWRAGEAHRADLEPALVRRVRTDVTFATTLVRWAVTGDHPVEDLLVATIIGEPFAILEGLGTLRSQKRCIPAALRVARAAIDGGGLDRATRERAEQLLGRLLEKPLRGQKLDAFLRQLAAFGLAEPTTRRALKHLPAAERTRRRVARDRLQGTVLDGRQATPEEWAGLCPPDPRRLHLLADGDDLWVAFEANDDAIALLRSLDLDVVRAVDLLGNDPTAWGVR